MHFCDNFHILYIADFDEAVVAMVVMISCSLSMTDVDEVVVAMVVDFHMADVKDAVVAMVVFSTWPTLMRPSLPWYDRLINVGHV